MDAMLIECILKRDGGTKVDLGGTTYHFSPDSEGRHVAMVADPDHIGRFLSITEGYRIPRAMTAIPATSVTQVAPIGAVGAIAPVTTKPDTEVERVSLDHEQSKGIQEPFDDQPKGDDGADTGMNNPAPPLDLASLDKEQLAAEYIAVLGQKPHPAMSAAKMIEKIKAASAA